MSYVGLEGYLRAMRHMRQSMGPLPPGMIYAGIEDYVLVKGHYYTSAALTPEEAALVRHIRSRGRYPIKQCFANSQRAMLDLDLFCSRGDSCPLKYVEGYVVRHDLPLPIHHGWLDLNGKVIDLTLRKPGGKGLVALGVIKNATYFGVEFTADEVRRFVVKNRVYGTILDDFENDWPILRGERP